MWTCPNCGRTFERNNQSHPGCVKPQSIDDYIALQPEEYRPYLIRIREIIAAALPEATEKISWGAPTFWKKRNIIQFAAATKHVGLYPGPAAVEFFAQRLTEFKTSKGTIQLPYAKPLPEELIADIARWNWETGNHP